ncbi:hypothetical protein TI39_contig428g00015 [Zymoseptoria brevis]|uniref:Uncharacterized protein n=1 Tax=Zymoseptoria brevis TaxID=1047168 RepID=A0A0F4GPR9_9PEZI|nr:hypothetical protein TI39_contig428g00015 [Zymoseptoria brevis]
MDDGLLLPFGADRSDFVVPNPSFFESPWWTMPEDADPRTGWDNAEILATPFAASNDLYGKIHSHVQSWLKKFHRQVHSRNIDLHFTCLAPKGLADHLVGSEAFARIDATTYADSHLQSGQSIDTLLGLFTPLLQAPHINPDATLLTLHREGVASMVKENRLPQTQKLTEMMHTMLLSRPVPRDDMSDSSSAYDVRFVLSKEGIKHVRDVDAWFAEYMKEHRFVDAAKKVGMAMRESHTIVEKWPTKLKRDIMDMYAAQEEYQALRASGLRGDERYIEWKRTAWPTEEGS